MLGLQRKQHQSGQVLSIDTDKVKPNPNQPRKHFDMVELQELAQSIRENGLLQPLTVRKNEQNEIELVSGERRLRAAKLLGMEQVPCIFVDMQEKTSAIFALLENVQRTDLNFFEEAEGIERLIVEYGLTQELCAIKLGKSQSTLSNKLRLLRLSPKIRRMIIDNHLSERHARALLKLDNDDDRQKALEAVIDEHLNVARTDKLVADIKNGRIGSRNEVVVVKDVRIFINTLDSAVQLMRRSGIDADTVKAINGEYVEYTVKIPAAQNFAIDKTH